MPRIRNPNSTLSEGETVFLRNLGMTDEAIAALDDAGVRSAIEAEIGPDFFDRDGHLMQSFPSDMTARDGLEWLMENGIDTSKFERFMPFIAAGISEREFGEELQFMREELEEQGRQADLTDKQVWRQLAIEESLGEMGLGNDARKNEIELTLGQRGYDVQDRHSERNAQVENNRIESNERIELERIRASQIGPQAGRGIALALGMTPDQVNNLFGPAPGAAGAGGAGVGGAGAPGAGGGAGAGGVPGAGGLDGSQPLAGTPGEALARYQEFLGQDTTLSDAQRSVIEAGAADRTSDVVGRANQAIGENFIRSGSSAGDPTLTRLQSDNTVKGAGAIGRANAEIETDDRLRTADRNAGLLGGFGDAVNDRTQSIVDLLSRLDFGDQNNPLSAGGPAPGGDPLATRGGGSPGAGNAPTVGTGAPRGEGGGVVIPGGEGGRAGLRTGADPLGPIGGGAGGLGTTAGSLSLSDPKAGDLLARGDVKPAPPTGNPLGGAGTIATTTRPTKNPLDAVARIAA